MSIYTRIIKPIAFRFDPEYIHDRVLSIGMILGRFQFCRKFISYLYDYKNPVLKQTVFGIDFINPIGLAAGFDKNAELTDIIPSVGFGHMEVGSITAKPCAGNAKPRLWRLKKSKGLVVYYGLKNDGAQKIHERLKNKKFAIPVSISIAMTNCIENLDIEHAIRDYVQGFETFKDTGAFFTVNISCPNAEGGQPFIDSHKLDRLLSALDKIHTEKPVCVKLSPDLNTDQVDLILDVLSRHRVHGIICSNLTKKRNNSLLVDESIPEKGGISGRPVADLSDRLLAYIYRKTGKKFVLIGCGGVFTAEDAYRKIKLGASLIHMITGMIFEGPGVVRDINAGLAELLKKDGFKNIADAVGSDIDTKLILVRHHESEWNKLGKWTGITNVDLTHYGEKMSQRMGLLIKDILVDYAFTSEQVRTTETLLCMEEEGVCLDIPVVKARAFNERDYGDYTGKNKWDMEKMLGKEEFEKLRRGWDYPIPHGETLKMVYDRVVPYYLSTIVPLLNDNKNTIIVAHGNSLRALIKYVEGHSDADMQHVEMPFGSVCIYTVDGTGKMRTKKVRSVTSDVHA